MSAIEIVPAPEQNGVVVERRCLTTMPVSLAWLLRDAHAPHRYVADVRRRDVAVRARAAAGPQAERIHLHKPLRTSPPAHSAPFARRLGISRHHKLQGLREAERIPAIDRPSGAPTSRAESWPEARPAATVANRWHEGTRTGCSRPRIYAQGSARAAPDRMSATARRTRRYKSTEAKEAMPNARTEWLRAARARLVDVEKRVERLARSLPEIEVAIRRAEGKIEADARDRIRMLHKEANEQLAVLRGHQREASSLLRQLSTAAEGSWGELEQAVDRALTEARAIADLMLERLRHPVPRRITSGGEAMDTAIVSGMAAIFGSLVGGSATVATAWVTQKTLSKRDLIRADIGQREMLYGEFIKECSKLVMDSLAHTLDKPETLQSAYELVNRIRLSASDRVLAEAEDVLRRLTEQYFSPNLSVEEMRTLVRSAGSDPLKGFGEGCRVELKSMRATV